MKRRVQIPLYSIFKKNRKILYVISAVLIVLIIVLLSRGGYSAYKNNSFNYQYTKAIECASTSHYEEAVVYLERALAIEPENTDARFLLAKYYDKSDRTQSSVKVLSEILELNTDIDVDAKDEIYDYLLSLYEKREEYDKMGEILKACDIQRIVTKYNKYAPLQPEFNKTEGVYNEISYLTMTANSKGIIYYTLDVSNPTTNSSVYESPVLLESGDYTVKALFCSLFYSRNNIFHICHIIVITMNKFINKCKYSKKVTVLSVTKVY